MSMSSHGDSENNTVMQQFCLMTCTVSLDLDSFDKLQMMFVSKGKLQNENDYKNY